VLFRDGDPYPHRDIPRGVLPYVPYRTVPIGRVASRILNRRLEDRIRELCALAIMASRDDERRIIAQLRSALKEHMGRLKRKAALKLVEHEDGFQERRAA
jgi:alkylhydroperoxidase/carboxymuconolactone decarboxylase family protein YurZ